MSNLDRAREILAANPGPMTDKRIAGLLRASGIGPTDALIKALQTKPKKTAAKKAKPKVENG